jgi:hypothetical protein
MITSPQQVAIDSHGNSRPSVLTTAGATGNGKFYITITNTTNADKAGLVILPDLYTTPTEGDSDIYGIGSQLASATGEKAEGITIDSTISEAMLNKMFINNAISIASCDLSTNNTDNYNNELIVNDSRREFLGKSKESQRIEMQGARVNVGNTYGESIPGFGLGMIKDSFMNLCIKKLCANSFLRISFNVDGIDNSYQMVTP